ncbi:hypothetical protein AAZX31_04G094300 [Glycine max]
MGTASLPHKFHTVVSHGCRRSSRGCSSQSQVNL